MQGIDEIRTKIAQTLLELSEQQDLKVSFAGVFLISCRWISAEHLQVLIDHLQGISFEHCEILSRALEDSLQKDKQDFELEVGAYGISDPLCCAEHYVKNIGRTLDITTNTAEKIRARLLEVQGDFLILLPVFSKNKGKKKTSSALQEEPCKLNRKEQIKTAHLVLEF